MNGRTANKKKGIKEKDSSGDMENLKVELDQTKAYCESYKLQLEKGTAYVAQLETDVSEKTSKITLLEKKAATLKSSQEIVIKQLKDEISEKTANINDLTLEITDMENSSNEMEQKYNLLVSTEIKLKTELNSIKIELIESQKKIEKLEKNNSNPNVNSKNKNGGQTGRSGGGYDANADRISDLEEELENVKLLLQKSKDDNIEEMGTKEEELDYYKNQSDQYLKKLQEVRIFFFYDMF